MGLGWSCGCVLWSRLRHIVAVRSKHLHRAWNAQQHSWIGWVVSARRSTLVWICRFVLCDSWKGVASV